MTSVEDVVGSLNADLDALQEIQARIDEARAEAEELFAGLQTAGAQAAANAVGAAKEQLAECASMTAASAIPHIGTNNSVLLGCGASVPTSTGVDMTTASFQPEGYTTVTAWIVTDDTAKLLDFITEVFDGAETGRIPTEDGGIGHAEIKVGDTTLLAFDRRPDWPELPSLLRIWVADPDAAVEKAVKAGARVVTELSNAAWGDRGARIRDPFGNIWWIMSHIEDVPEAEVWTRMSAPGYAEQMENAQKTFDAELTGRTGRSSRPVNPA